ncbi:Fic family protein [Scytonema sp. UIC 10036]|uniref:Fic family protein n=1 Tax=Scytonema sp. UIC 10036 TaxID=2304196 RepID=UPI001FAA423C|nr:Fic family protein [Scytonema sp. UIC 10036]
MVVNQVPSSSASSASLTEIAAQCYDTFIQMLIQHRLVDMAKEIQNRLSVLANMTLSDKFQQVNQLKAWLDSFRPLPTTVVAELKKLYDVRFTYNSNAIEGNTLTQSETALVLETGITIGGKTLREHLEVIGHKDAIDYIEQLAQNSTPIGEWEIKQIHNLILRAISPEEVGRYRQLDVRAAGTEYVYPPHYLLNDFMTEFVTWLNSPETAVQHPIEFAAEAHLRFVSIHPFRDGNGRTGRLLMNLLLLRSGYPIVVISNQVRKAYIDAVVEGQQQNNLSPLLTLLLDAAQQSLIEMLHVLSTAWESRGRGLPFYEEMLAFLSEHY